jgi:hypothetical protein
MMSDVSLAAIIRQLMQDRRLRPSEKCVGWAILNRLGCSDTGTAKILIKQIAGAVCVSERKIQLACMRLAECEYLVVTKRHGRASLYSLPGAPETTIPAGARVEAASGLEFGGVPPQ